MAAPASEVASSESITFTTSITPSAKITTEPLASDTPPATSDQQATNANANDAELAAQWAALKARRWREGKALTAHVQDLALAAGKRALVATSGGSYKKFVCASATPCGWLINAVCSRPRRSATGDNEESDGRYWYVTSGSLAHDATCSSAAKPTARQLKRSALLQSVVLGDARVSSSAIVAQLKAHGNLECSKSMVYKAKTDLLDALEAQQRRQRRRLNGADTAAAGASTGAAEGDDELLLRPLPVPTVAASVQKLPSFLEQMASLNAHASSAVERDESGQFVRAVLAMDPTCAWHAQGVLALDALETRHPLYSGAQLLMLLGRDGNLEPIVHAAALVPSATASHCAWFLDKLLAHGFPLRRFPVFVTAKWLADGPSSLMTQLPHVLLSTRSVLDDVLSARHGVTVAREDESIVWLAQRAESESEFLEALARLGQRNFAAAHCLKTALDARRWALFPHVTARKLYGWQTTQIEAVDFGGSRGNNSSGNILMVSDGLMGLPPQSTSPASSTASSLPTSQLPYECFQSLALYLMSRSFARHERAVQWAREQRVVTPAAEQLMQEQLARAGEYNVVLSTPQLAFVWNASAPQVRQRRVDLQHRTCTCALRLQLGVPCRHTLAALRKLEQHALLAPSAFEFFDECYLVRNYASAFQCRYLELPLDENVVRDETLHPPLLTMGSSAGSGALARPRSLAENGDVAAQPAAKSRKRRPRHKPAHERKRGIYKCHRCHRAEGHNRGTCPYDREVPAE